MDAGITAVESFHVVTALKNNGGVTIAVDACPLVSLAIRTVDSHARERHGGTWVNADLHVFSKRAGKNGARLYHDVAGNCAEVHVGGVSIGAFADGAGYNAADGHGAARATVASADAVGNRGKSADGGGDTGHGVGDGDVSARGIIAAADTTIGMDVTSLDNDVATGETIASTNGPQVAVSVERAAALNGQRLARWNVNAGIFVIEWLHGVRTDEVDGGIAQTVDACPFIVAT